MAPKSGFEMCFATGSKHQQVLGGPTKTRLASSPKIMPCMMRCAGARQCHRLPHTRNRTASLSVYQSISLSVYQSEFIYLFVVVVGSSSICLFFITTRFLVFFSDVWYWIKEQHTPFGCVVVGSSAPWMHAFLFRCLRSRAFDLLRKA